MNRTSQRGGSTPIDDYLATVPPPQRHTLDVLRARIRTLLPWATESIAYGIATHDLDGVHAIGYAAFGHHCSLFPYSAEVVERHAADLRSYICAKGTIRFPIDRPLALPLLRRLIRTRLDQMSVTWPRTGTARMFYADGALRVRGQTKDGRAHGRWTWVRRDGVVWREGYFSRGVASGIWSTFDRAGDCVRTGPAPRRIRIP